MAPLVGPALSAGTSIAVAPCLAKRRRRTARVGVGLIIVMQGTPLRSVAGGVLMPGLEVNPEQLLSAARAGDGEARGRLMDLYRVPSMSGLVFFPYRGTRDFVMSSWLSV